MVRGLKRSQRIAWRRVQDEVLIISSDSNSLTVLNDTGARVWELLEDHTSRDALAAAIAAEFDVEEARARTDIDSFLEEMRRRQIVVDAPE